MFNIITNYIKNILTLSPIHCDAPEPWLIGFQDGASATQEGITELHDAIFFYLILIGTGVAFIIGTVVYHFNSNTAPISHRYYNHGTLIELVWTITPAFVLIAIAFPSFKLLYLMDVQWSTTEDFIAISIAASIPIKNLHSDCTALVPYGVVGSTLGISFNKYVRNLIHFPKDIVCQFVGHLLGDASLVFSRTSITPSFVFVQSLSHFSYLWSVFHTLHHYCKAVPYLVTSVRNDTATYGLYLTTRSYPILLELHNMFYTLVGGKYIKIISLDLLEYLTPITLAIWAIDDGAATTKGYGFYLHTSGFTFNDVYLLAGMLHYQFGLICTVQNKQGKPVLYITNKSISLFRSLVMPHMHYSMLYKINSNR